MSLVQISMEENHFHFMGEHYKQLKGAPMENPISPFIMFIIKLETGLTSGGLMLTLYSEKTTLKIRPTLRYVQVSNLPWRWKRKGLSTCLRCVIEEEAEDIRNDDPHLPMFWKGLVKEIKHTLDAARQNVNNKSKNTLLS